MCVLFWETKNSDVCQDRGNTSATVSVPSRLLRFLAAWCCCCCFLSSSKLSEGCFPSLCYSWDSSPVFTPTFRVFVQPRWWPLVWELPLLSFLQASNKSSARVPLCFRKGCSCQGVISLVAQQSRHRQRSFFYHLHQKALCSSRFLCEMRSSPGCFSGLDPAIWEGAVPFKALLNFGQDLSSLQEWGCEERLCASLCESTDLECAWQKSPAYLLLLGVFRWTTGYIYKSCSV